LEITHIGISHIGKECLVQARAQEQAQVQEQEQARMRDQALNVRDTSAV